MENMHMMVNLREKSNKIYTFFSYWYMRYLLVTELYIVEPWERALMHILMFIFFSILSYLNVQLIMFLGAISLLLQGDHSTHLSSIR